MPVTRISAEVACSSNDGASRWIGMRRVVLTGPFSSIGSPITLRMRPRVSGPTGTVIGAPVSTTSWPRTMPSVLSMAMQRTVRSPSSWATSSTRVRSSILLCSAFWMNGRSPSNWTSTTAPRTWVTRPTILLAIVLVPLDGFRAGDDFDQFLGDVRLACAVVVLRQPLDHIACVARCIVHRGHPRAVLTGGTFQHRAVDLDRQRLRQQLGQDGFLVRLKLINGTAGIDGFAFRWRRGGDDLLFGHDLGDDRVEAVIDDRRHIDFAGGEHGGDA